MLRVRVCVCVSRSIVCEGQNLLKIDLTDWSGQTNHAFYQNFRIANEEVH